MTISGRCIAPFRLRVALAYFLIRSIPLISAQDIEAHEGTEILEVKTDGNIMVGGLFPIHEDGSYLGRHCAAIKPDKGVQRMEAMLWAIDEINKNKQLLPGVKLGVHILDTCNQDTHGLEQTLEFIKTSMSASNNAAMYRCTDHSKPLYNPPKPIVAVIGAANSQVSAMVANVLRLFKMPQISYSSTSAELSDKSRFEYFSRVVPPDDLQARAMVDVVDRLGWTYVSAVADEGNYGEQGMEQFRSLAANKKICLATYEKIRRSYQEKEFTELVQRLAKIEANGVVMFCHEDNVKKILKALSDLDLSMYRKFAFVASDNWGNKRTPVMEHPTAAIGAITIQPKVIPIKANSLAKKHVQDGYVPFVIDAVYVFAHALNATIRQHCFGKSYSMCSLAEEGINGTELLHLIRNISFIGPQGEEIQLDHRGDRMGRYNIYQFRGLYEQYKQVGAWTNKTCQECNLSSIMPNDSTCVACEIGYLPNEGFRNECVPMIPQTMEWYSLWSIIPCTLSTLGIIATIFVFGVFVKYSKTPVIMASGRELCYMMLVGIILAYAMTFALIHPPNSFTCGVIRAGLGTTLSIIYASILTKTSRLARIFTSNVRSMQRPKFISPRAQVIICSLLISGQVIGAMIWITVEPPRAMLVYPTRMEAVLSCKATATPTLLSLTYICVLICLCTLYAFKTRKIPENFNETKHIGFTMYATCIIWLAFVPIYFGTNNNFKIQITSMCMCISISAAVALVCFFAPKVYIVLFQPNKNVRPSSNMSSFQKLQIGMVQQQMRFLRPRSEYESTLPTSQTSQYSNVLVGKSVISASTNGDLQRLEESSTSFMASGVVKRRRSSVLKQLLPHSESRHNRVGTLPVGGSHLNNSSNSTRRESKLKNINMMSSLSSLSSMTIQNKSDAAPSEDLRIFLQPSSASIDQTSLIISRMDSKSISNQSSYHAQNEDDDKISAKRSDSDNADKTSRSISISQVSSNLALSSPKTPNVQKVNADEAAACLLTSAPIAWAASDPRSEFEIILTEINNQEGTFV